MCMRKRERESLCAHAPLACWQSSGRHREARDARSLSLCLSSLSRFLGASLSLSPGVCVHALEFCKSLNDVSTFGSERREARECKRGADGEREEECEREKSELVSIQLIKQEPPYMRVREGGMEAGVRVSRSVIVYLEAKSSLTSKAKGEREREPASFPRRLPRVSGSSRVP